MQEGHIEIYFVKELGGKVEVEVRKEHKPTLILKKTTSRESFVYTVMTLLQEALRADA